MMTTLPVVLAIGLLLAGCASDGDDAATTTTTTSTTAFVEAERVADDEQSAVTTSDAMGISEGEPQTEGSAGAQATGFSLMDFRYCEILLTVVDGDGNDVTQVWGTPGVDPCSDEAWYALDADEIQAENGASFVRMNGPRYFVVDGTIVTGDGTGIGTASGGETVVREFGDITMALLATTEATGESAPYVPDLVARTTTWTFEAGTEVYELTDPDGLVYTMQSYSLIEDRSLTSADLPSLGDRLDLPEGWSYSARVLDEPLQVALSGDGAVVVQDELNNAYQRNG